MGGVGGRVGKYAGADPQTLTEEMGQDERQNKPARARAVLERGARDLAAPEQVALPDAHFADHAVGGRIAARERELAGRLLLDVDIDHDAVGRRARLIVDLDVLEVVEVPQTALAAIDERPVV